MFLLSVVCHYFDEDTTKAEKKCFVKLFLIPVHMLPALVCKLRRTEQGIRGILLMESTLDIFLISFIINLWKANFP